MQSAVRLACLLICLAFGPGAAGQIDVKFRSASPTNKAIYGEHLIFSPTDNGGSLSWKCNSTVGTTVNDKYLPTVCRQ